MIFDTDGFASVRSVTAIPPFTWKNARSAAVVPTKLAVRRFNDKDSCNETVRDRGATLLCKRNCINYMREKKLSQDDALMDWGQTFGPNSQQDSSGEDIVRVMGSVMMQVSQGTWDVRTTRQEQLSVGLELAHATRWLIKHLSLCVLLMFATCWQTKMFLIAFLLPSVRFTRRH